MTITALQNIPSITDPLNFKAENEHLWNVQVPLLIQQINTDIQALNFGNLNATSTTSVLIGTGSKTFTIQTGKGWTGGMWGIAADAAAASTNSMQFQVTSYNSGTGVLVVNVPAGGTLGSGTLTNWVISWTPPGGLTQTALTALLQNQSATGFTAAGTQPTYTVTTGYGAQAAGQRLRVIFPTVTTFGAQPTLNRDGLGAVNIVQYDGAGVKQRGRILIANQRCDLEYDGTDFVILNPIRNAIIDLNGYTGADIPLGVGETATYTPTAVTSQALRLATADNQVYVRRAQDTGAAAGVTVNIDLQMNNTDYVGVFGHTQAYIDTSTGASTGNSTSLNRFGLNIRSCGYVSPYSCEIYTAAASKRKSVTCQMGSFASASGSFNGGFSSINDNAVAWTSMGTEFYGRSYSGVVSYTRVR